MSSLAIILIKCNCSYSCKEKKKGGVIRGAIGGAIGGAIEGHLARIACMVRTKWVIIFLKERFDTYIVGELGYPAQPKISNLEPTWPCRPGSSDYLDSAFYLPGPESDKQAEKFRDIFD